MKSQLTLNIRFNYLEMTSFTLFWTLGLWKLIPCIWSKMCLGP